MYPGCRKTSSRKTCNLEEKDEMHQRRWNGLGNKGRDGIRGMTRRTAHRRKAMWDSGGNEDKDGWRGGGRRVTGRDSGAEIEREGDGGREGGFKERLPFVLSSRRREEHLK